MVFAKNECFWYSINYEINSITSDLFFWILFLVPGISGSVCGIILKLLT